MFTRASIFFAMGAALAAWFTAGGALAQPDCKPSGTVKMAADRSIRVEIINSTGPLLIRADQEAYQGYLDIVGGLVPGETKPYFPIRATAEPTATGAIHVVWWGSSVEDGSREETLEKTDWRFAWVTQS